MNVIEFPKAKPVETEEPPVVFTELFSYDDEAFEEAVEEGFAMVTSSFFNDAPDDVKHSILCVQTVVREHLTSPSKDNLDLEIWKDNEVFYVSLEYKESLSEKELLLQYGVNFKGAHWTFPDVQPHAYYKAICFSEYGHAFTYSCVDEEHKDM